MAKRDAAIHAPRSLIFAVVFVGAAGAFFSGVKLWGRISRVDVPSMFVILDLQRLGRDLRESVDVPLIGFKGSDREVSFPAVDGVHVVRVVYTFDPDRKEFLRKSYVFDPAAEEGRSETPAVVTKIFDADELRFNYLDGGGESPVWQDTWSKEKGIFRAMRVEGAFKGEPFTKIIIIPQA